MRRWAATTPTTTACRSYACGWARSYADDTPDNPRSVAGYTSWEDAMRMFSLCIDAPDNVRYDLFELVSDNRYRWRDNAHAKEVLGYKSTRNSDPFIRP